MDRIACAPTGMTFALVQREVGDRPDEDLPPLDAAFVLEGIKKLMTGVTINAAVETTEKPDKKPGKRRRTSYLLRGCGASSRALPHHGTPRRSPDRHFRPGSDPSAAKAYFYSIDGLPGGVIPPGPEASVPGALRDCRLVELVDKSHLVPLDSAGLTGWAGTREEGDLVDNARVPLWTADQGLT